MNQSSLKELTTHNRRWLLLGLYDVLERAMGPTNWWPAETPFEVCIGAILTQNAPWSGVARAIANLKHEGLFDSASIACADEKMLADLIRPSIYYNQKARRLKAFCLFLEERYGGAVENLAVLGLEEVRTILLSLPGIGFETADSMLLYVLKKPIFVVDAYTKRIFLRHGLAQLSWGYEDLRHFVEDVLTPDPVKYGEFHALLCLVGAQFCKRTPQCDACPVREVLGSPAL